MNRMKSLREETGKKQSEIGELLNVSQTTYSDWETDKHMPDKDSLFELARIYDTSIDYMLGYSMVRKVSDLDNPLKIYLLSKYGREFSSADLDNIEDIIRAVEKYKRE